jgi:nicotinamidase-related amidase
MRALPAHDADADTRSRADVLRRDDTAVLVVDVQEAFRPHLPGFDDLVRDVCLLVGGARELDVPVVLTEQYPEGLGATASEILEAAGDAEIVAKLEFSAVRAAGFEELLRRLGRSQLLVCGLEAHVCVHQTVVDLLRRGLSVHLAVDAVGSLDPVDREIGVRRALSGGAHASSVEMALFELLGVAGSEEFRAVHALIKAAGPVHNRRVGGGVR